MDNDKERCGDYVAQRKLQEMTEVRKGPWNMEEDLKLIDCVATHGPGHWSYLARSSGLKRTGKSCRLRWLNYLHPDVKRGNLTLEEQILILELHSRWGNRWSKIAQQLPGRTDNDIKNYWRTRVQKLAKQLNCDVNSMQFRETMRHLWLPRLAEQVQAGSAQSPMGQPSTSGDNVIDCINYADTTGYGPVDSNTKYEQAQVTLDSSDLVYYGDDDVVGSYWWECFQQDDQGLIDWVVETPSATSQYYTS